MFSWPNRLLFLSFAAVVASFFAANHFVQRSSERISALAEQITQNTGPGIERLGALRDSVLGAELLLDRVLETIPPPKEGLEQLERETRHAEAVLRDYLLLPPLAGESALRRELIATWQHYARTSQHTQEALPQLAAGQARNEEIAAFRSAGQGVLNAASAIISFSGAHVREVAEEIHDSRRQTNRLANVLNAACGIFAALVAWLLYKESAGRRKMIAEHSGMLEARAEEMENFAGRVAHDIRNPLSAARLSAELALRKAHEDGPRASIQSALRSLSRADAIISALLDFARAGAKPDPGAREDVRALVGEVVTDLGPQAEEVGITLRAEPAPAVLVACNRGVYLIALGNFVRNAMKYMGEGGERRVTVTVVRSGDTVRTSVEDTGPGIRPEVLPNLFTPYFRADAAGRAEGLGLGLATVKKLVEGHGGRAGVESTLGRGSTFFFELPYAGAAPDAPDAPGGDLPDLR